jgi:RHS repeat-associated protein
MDDRGRGVNSYSYTPFGVAYNVKEKVDQPYRYTGRRWDPNVGKLWYRSRHYDAARGSFSQNDKWKKSITNPIFKSRYSYVGSNPVNWTDPFGFEKLIFSLNNKVGLIGDGPGLIDTSFLTSDYKNATLIKIENFKNVYTSILDRKGKEQITDILFIGEGTTFGPAMPGLYPGDWREFRQDNWDELEAIFSKNLNIEFRMCDTGVGNYLENVALELPSGTTVTGYTDKIVTSLVNQAYTVVNDVAGINLIGYESVDNNRGWGAKQVSEVSFFGISVKLTTVVDPKVIKKSVLNNCGKIELIK